MQKEIWKDIPDYEGLYQASNLGRVKSLKREVYSYNGYRIIKERILKFTITRYYYVSLRKYNKTKKFYVHQLIAMAFLNQKISGV